MGYRSDKRKHKGLSDILWVSANAPEPTRNELLVVFLVILAMAPCRFLFIGNWMDSLIRDSPHETMSAPPRCAWKSTVADEGSSHIADLCKTCPHK